MNNRQDVVSRVFSLPFFRHVLMWSGPTVVDNLSKTMVAFAALSLLGKTEYGYYSAGLLVFSYLGLLQFGVSDALMLRLPEHYVNQSWDAYWDSVNAALSFSTLMIGVLGPVLVFGFFGLTTDLTQGLVSSAAAFWISGLFYQIYFHALVGIRYSYQLDVSSKMRASAGLFRLTIQVAALFVFGFYGLLVTEVMVYWIPLLLLRGARASRTGIRLSLSRSTVKSLLREGAPIFLVSLIALLSTTIDRWMILATLGIEGLADYSALVFIGAGLTIIFSHINSMFAQYTKEKLTLDGVGASVFEDYFTFFTVSLLSLLMISCFLLPICFLLFQAIWPQYQPSFGGLSFILGAYAIRNGYSCFSNFLIINKMNREIIVANAFGLGLFFVSYLVLAQAGKIGVLPLSIVVFVVAIFQYWILFTFALTSDLKTNRKRSQFVFRNLVLTLLACVFSGAFYISRFLVSGPTTGFTWASVIGASLVVLVLLTFVFIRLDRRGLLALEQILRRTFIEKKT